MTFFPFEGPKIPIEIIKSNLLPLRRRLFTLQKITFYHIKDRHFKAKRYIFYPHFTIRKAL